MDRNETSQRSRAPLLLIAVAAQNGVIGAGDRLLWRLSSDLKRFKALTLGKPLVMGRKTFQSIGRPLPGRETIVVTRDRDFTPDGALVAHDLDAALALAEARAAAMGADAIVIAGGGELYAQTIAACRPSRHHRGRARARRRRRLSADRPGRVARGPPRTRRPRPERRGGLRLRGLRAGEALEPIASFDGL